MGLGKTIQAIAAAEIMARHLDVERVLIVCPTSLKHQWEREIAKFSKRSARVIHGFLVYPAVYLLWRQRELPREDGTVIAPRGWHKLALGSGVAVAILIAATMFFARGNEAQPLYPRYDAVRQALVKQSLPEAKARANELAEAARDNERDTIATHADMIAKATELEAARHAFAELSDAMIAYRKESKEAPKPVVVYCSMAKHSWLQAKGPISNPYFDASMAACGEIQAN